MYLWRLKNQLAVSLIVMFCRVARAIDIETVLIGSPGNLPDVRQMNDGTCCYGSVAYDYRIGKYEVTNNEFAVFLNAIATTDTYEIYEPFFMGATLSGGILRSGGAPSYVYTVEPNMGDKPVMGVTTAAAMRFANWLHNGQPTGTQSPATTEDGAYSLSGSSLPLRNASAEWWIPNDNEWYKAAYYDPRDTSTGGPPGHYWLYPTKSLGLPTAATANSTGSISNPGTTTVNYNSNANWNGSDPFGNVTTVGSAGLSSASYFGTFDQAGNAAEHNDTPTQFGPNTRVVRGGQFTSLSDAISSEVRGYCAGCYAGLRIASILNPTDPGGGGPVAYWNAENGATDVTGNNHDGVFQGNATTITSGPFGKAFTFDGSGDYINIGDELDMGTSNFTLSAWLKADPTMDQWGRIFDKGYNSAYSLHRRATSNEIGFEMLNSGNVFATTTPLIDNTWHHVALVKNGTTVTIYADGDPENSNTVSAAPQNNSRSLLIGFNPGEGTQGFWKGLLDELKIFDRALSAAEVAALAIAPNILEGDFDFDGDVDAADYVVWRKRNGTPQEYAAWRAHFGQSFASGSETHLAAGVAAVPEPTSAPLLVTLLTVGLGRSNRLRNQLRLRGY